MEGTIGTIRCCECGQYTQADVAIQGHCLSCAMKQNFIQKINLEATTLEACDRCGKVRNEKNAWVMVEMESRDLLAILLKKIKKNKIYKLVDARLVAHPHTTKTR